MSSGVVRKYIDKESSLGKYVKSQWQVSRLVQDSRDIIELTEHMDQLVIFSQTSNTWSKHKAVWNCLDKFAVSEDIQLTWPISIETIRTFVVWCLCFKNLKPSTVKAYLSSIKFAHELKGLKYDLNRDKIVSLALKGAENKQLLTHSNESCRRAVTIHVLLLIGHRIANSNWCEISKQVFWTACTTSFFTGARMGELLSPKEKDFDPSTTLLWKNLFFMNSDEILIFLPHTKVKGPKGEFVDLFAFKNGPCCPVKSLLLLKSLHEKNNSFDLEKPVFMFSSGKFLTTAKMNNILHDLLLDVCGPSNSKISCHSFRAGIPSSLHKFSDKNATEDIKNFGRWRGSSYKLYVRLERDRRRMLFDNIYNVLSSVVSNK